MVAAHRDTHFKFLQHLRVGTRVAVQTVDGREYSYRFVESHILDTRFEQLTIDDGSATLTLLTCYPFDAVMPGGPLRYAAVAELIDDPLMTTRVEKMNNANF